MVEVDGWCAGLQAAGGRGVAAATGSAARQTTALRGVWRRMEQGVAEAGERAFPQLMRPF
eukprot:COSAG01_NODE_4236_length_5216_cov_4.101231_7_plen_60_part_00